MKNPGVQFPRMAEFTSGDMLYITSTNGFQFKTGMRLDIVHVRGLWKVGDEVTSLKNNDFQLAN